jgi:hypothetical protein
MASLCINFRFTAVLLIHVMWVTNTFSQSIIHIENHRLAAKGLGFSGTIETTLNFIQNINDIFQTQNNAQLQYTVNDYSFLSISSFNQTILNGRNIVNEGFQHLRLTFKPRRILSYDGFVQGQFNEIILIKNRYLVASGLRTRIWESDSLRWYSGTLFMREVENELTGITNHHWRISQYLSLGGTIKNGISFDFIGYYQPDIMNFKDFRTSAEITFEFNWSKRWGIRLIHSLFHDSNPPESIRSTFYNFRNGIALKL